MVEELTPRDVSISVGTTAVEVAPDRSGPHRRKLISLTNTSTGSQNVSIVWGQIAVAGIGIYLKPGASHLQSIDVAFKPSNMRITAISDGAGGTIAVHEEIEPRV